MTENNGGSAFPYTLDDTGVFSSGMTLRDYFAGQALVGIYAGKVWNEITLRDNPEAWTYRIADSMLAARLRND